MTMISRLDLDRANSDVVLIVDDVPDNLAVLHDALDAAGYTDVGGSMSIAGSQSLSFAGYLQARGDLRLHGQPGGHRVGRAHQVRLLHRSAAVPEGQRHGAVRPLARRHDHGLRATAVVDVPFGAGNDRGVGIAEIISERGGGDECG